MVEEFQTTEAQETTVAQVEEVVVVTDVPPAEKTSTPPVPLSVTDEEEDVKPKQVEEASKEPEALKSSASGNDSAEKMPQSDNSFKEESTRVADLSDSERKALEELKQLVQEALHKHEFSTKTSSKEKKPATEPVVNELEMASEKREIKSEKEEISIPGDDQETHEVNEEKTKTAASDADAVDDDGAKTVEAIEETIVAVSSSVQQEQPQSPETKMAAFTTENESNNTNSETEISPEKISIWGIPLLADERSDVILLKFLRARDFKVKDAFTMLQNTIQWREEFGIDELIEQDLDDDFEKVVFMHGLDKEGHPVCYNVYGEFQNKELYPKSFSDEEKRQRFLRWRIQFLERSIRKLDFTPGGISTFVQINDLKNSPGPAKWELRQATKQALHLLQDNYPEFVAKQVSTKPGLSIILVLIS